MDGAIVGALGSIRHAATVSAFAFFAAYRITSVAPADCHVCFDPVDAVWGSIHELAHASSGFVFVVRIREYS